MSDLSEIQSLDFSGLVESLPTECSVTGRAGRSSEEGIDWEPVMTHNLLVSRNADGEVRAIQLADRFFAIFDTNEDIQNADEVHQYPMFWAQDYCFELQGLVAAPTRRLRM